ncbi:OmpA family protein [Saccharophagus degradans]|uniref:OmpA/MotB n=1 Tax=Saccharophagus degradans (strain 2-40 / ATCC 43961 / DSM 17024) TaxID=203122 RepID=Q21JM1_SACD2|nr:OmpA family protein [Saccharophagus degradans]ABD81108.1 OmpA/MotB [Saccharophagus degradans 2-40]
MRIQSLASLIVIASATSFTVGCSTANTDTAGTENQNDYELVSMKIDQDVYNATGGKSAVVSVETPAEQEQPKQEITHIEDVVYFEFDSKELTAEAEQKLEKLANEAKKSENENIVVVLKGFADATGPEEYNQELSKERAQNVKAFLESNGVEAREYNVVALGESNPVADNDTKQGRAQNRRVVLVIEPTESVASF